MAGDYNLDEFIDIECNDLVTIHGNLRLFIGQYDHPVFNKLNFYDLKYINKTIKSKKKSPKTNVPKWVKPVRITKNKQ